MLKTINNFFKLIDKDNSKLDLKIKEALYINRRKPNINALSSPNFTIA